MKKSLPLPLVGPLSYYLPLKDGRPSRAGLKGELRQIAQAELAIVRGEFSGMDRFYAAIPKNGRNFLAAAGIALYGAIGSDDPRLFDAVLKDIAAFPSRYGSPEAKLAVEIVTLWINKFLHVSKQCPDWLVHLDLSSIPAEWRHQVAYLEVECLARRGEYKAASVLADALLNLNPEKAASGSSAEVFLKMAKAHVCRDEGRMAESAKWCREVVESAKSLGIVLPFLGMVMGPKSVLERALAKDAPELLAKVKKLTNGYFRNLVKYHNRFTGESVTEDLTPREFFLAQSLKNGFRYKEIAERLGVSLNRVHAMAKDVYATLGVRGASAIGDRVW